MSYRPPIPQAIADEARGWAKDQKVKNALTEVDGRIVEAQLALSEAESARDEELRRLIDGMNLSKLAERAARATREGDQVVTDDVPFPGGLGWSYGRRKPGSVASTPPPFVAWLKPEGAYHRLSYLFVHEMRVCHYTLTIRARDGREKGARADTAVFLPEHLR